MTSTDSHENFSRADNVKSGSEKSFGIVFSVVFVIIGLWPLINSNPVRFWAIGTAALFLAAAFFVPQILAPINRVWFLFGLLLHKIVSPLVMGLVFFLTVTPIAVIMRLLGKRPLPLEFDKDVESYWIKRDPVGPEPETMKRQF